VCRLRILFSFLNAIITCSKCTKSTDAELALLLGCSRTRIANDVVLITTLHAADKENRILLVVVKWLCSNFKLGHFHYLFKNYINKSINLELKMSNNRKGGFNAPRAKKVMCEICRIMVDNHPTSQMLHQ
jgi:hypothetical protein